MIPDIALHEVIKSCLLAIRADYSTYGSTPSDTLLYKLLNSVKSPDTGKYKWFEESVEIFITRNENHPKFLDTRLFFDRERAAIPTIHIMLSGEGAGKNGIGMDLGFNPEQVIGGSFRQVLNRQFDINANIVVTSDNTFETVIIYHVIKSMIISLSTHIQLLGFISPDVSGRDITISQDLVPAGIFARVLNFTASYELEVPESVLSQIIQGVWIQMTNINLVQVTPPIGPSSITTANDILTSGQNLPGN